jgi:tetratricopeptide (TPR) repeat protein
MRKKTIYKYIQSGVFVLVVMLCNITTIAAQIENHNVRSGNNYYRGRDYDRAEKEYRASVSKNPSSFFGNYNLGNALYRKSDWPTARTYYQKALQYTTEKKEKADALHNIGCTYLQEQKYKESVDALQKSLMQNPNSDKTRNLLAYAQRMLKKQQKNQPPKANSGDKKKKDDNMSQENAKQILQNLDDEQKAKPSDKKKQLLKNW